MRVLDLFAGIGGFTLGLEKTGGFETVGFCEIDPFCQSILKKHWPDVPIFNDIRKLYRFAHEYEPCECCGEPYCELCEEHFAECECYGCSEFDDEIGTIDVITGGFPCQDISVAGKQEGINGSRSGLWSEIARLIGCLQPQYAILENVTALLSGDRGRWFGRILGDLAEVGYDCQWHCIPASELGAHHRRDRVWIVAYPKGKRIQGQRASGEQVAFTHALAELLMCSREAGGTPYWKTEPNVGRVVDGVSQRSHRIKSLGNAVVPQIPELIGKAIMDFEKGHTL